MSSLLAIDIFCGAGGLTTGLKQAGFKVIGAVDADKTAIKTYSLNHVHEKPESEKVSVWYDHIQKDNLIDDMMSSLGLKKGKLDLLSGCPPCEGFSTLRTLNGKYKHKEDKKKNDLVYEFLRFVRSFRPKAIMMENVPGLAKDSRMDDVLSELSDLGYYTGGSDRTEVLRVLDAADYNVPQRRKRMILMTGRGFSIDFAEKTPERPTVRQAIENLKPPSEGTAEDKETDPLHYHGERRTAEIKDIMSRIKPGESRRDLPKEYWLECQKNTDGFKDVYGRMEWDEVAPTITSGCTNPSKGRFIHPDMEQNRAITLREAALLQTFPEDYQISMDRGKSKAAELIGDALPPEFIRRHALRAKEKICNSKESSLA